LARSGVAACRLLRARGFAVYASDAARSEGLEADGRRLTAEGCAVQLGGHDLGRIASATVVVVSPGVPPTAPPLVAAAAAGRTIISELDLAARFLPGTKLIVTSGTKGKSTTASLIATMLQATWTGPGEVAGNFGLPLANVALQSEHPGWLSVEASSFQLHDCPTLTPAVGVLTNLSPDHLDRYDSVEAYYADKARLFRGASIASRWVSNGDDAAVVAMTHGVEGRHERFSLDVPIADAWYDRSGGWLVLRGMPLVRRADLQLLGDHNVANALAAALAVPPDLTDRDAIAAAIKAFRPLHHRLEPVREVAAVLWVNDSKATTVSAALSAVQSVGRPVVLLLGGKDKGGDFGELVPALRGARGVVAYGEAGDRIARELAGHVTVLKEEKDFDQVLARARSLAKPGDAVLLSPACSSFDMFQNAEDRGEQFTRWVQSL
jgi:UDP-N-acetylmuramoylalanine--D-glutamate ligase